MPLGFMPGGGVTDTIFILQYLQENYIHKRKDKTYSKIEGSNVNADATKHPKFVCMVLLVWTQYHLRDGSIKVVLGLKGN